MPNRLVVDEDPYLVPLLELLYRQRRYLVVHTDTHRGRLYTAVPGAVRLIEEIDEAVPKRQRAAGELWGKRQARSPARNFSSSFVWSTPLTAPLRRIGSRVCPGRKGQICQRLRQHGRIPDDGL